MSEHAQEKQRDDSYDRVELQNTDAIFVHCQPNSNPLLWRGSNGLRAERKRTDVTALFFYLNGKNTSQCHLNEVDIACTVVKYCINRNDL